MPWNISTLLLSGRAAVFLKILKLWVRNNVTSNIIHEQM